MAADAGRDVRSTPPDDVYDHNGRHARHGAASHSGEKGAKTQVADAGEGKNFHGETASEVERGAREKMHSEARSEWVRKSLESRKTPLQLGEGDRYKVTDSDCLSTIAERRLRMDGEKVSGKGIENEVNRLRKLNSGEHHSLETKKDYLRVGWNLKIYDEQTPRKPAHEKHAGEGRGSKPELQKAEKPAVAAPKTIVPLEAVSAAARAAEAPAAAAPKAIVPLEAASPAARPAEAPAAAVQRSIVPLDSAPLTAVPAQAKPAEVASQLSPQPVIPREAPPPPQVRHAPAQQGPVATAKPGHWHKGEILPPPPPLAGEPAQPLASRAGAPQSFEPSARPQLGYPPAEQPRGAYPPPNAPHRQRHTEASGPEQFIGEVLSVPGKVLEGLGQGAQELGDNIGQGLQQLGDGIASIFRSTADRRNFYAAQNDGNSCSSYAMAMFGSDWQTGRPASAREGQSWKEIAGTIYQGYRKDLHGVARDLERGVPGAHTKVYDYGMGRVGPQSLQDLNRELAQGHTVIAKVINEHTGNPHYVYVAGRDAQGNYLVGDPDIHTHDEYHRGKYLEHQKPMDPATLLSMMHPRDGFVAGWKDTPTTAAAVPGTAAHRHAARLAAMQAARARQEAATAPAAPAVASERPSY